MAKYKVKWRKIPLLMLRIPRLVEMWETIRPILVEIVAEHPSVLDFVNYAEETCRLVVKRK